jgi:hypothetical protein
VEVESLIMAGRNYKYIYYYKQHNLLDPQAPLVGVLAKARGPAWVGPLSPHTGLFIVKPTLQPGQNKNVGAYPSL